MALFGGVRCGALNMEYRRLRDKVLIARMDNVGFSPFLVAIDVEVRGRGVGVA